MKVSSRKVPSPNGGFLLHAEKRRHRDRRNDRKKTSEHDDKAAADVPRNRFRRRTWIVVQAIAHTQTVESGAVIRRRDENW